MMKLKLHGEQNLFDLLPIILRNRGIEDIERFLNLDEDVLISPYKLDNIEEATDKIIEHLEKDSSFFMQIDEDTDGYASTAIMYKYLKNIKPDIKLEVASHGKKRHGINIENIPSDTDIIIIPDASSNEYEKHELLSNSGLDIVIIDHHEAEKYSESAIVVNNQLSEEYENKALSATGVVFKVCQVLDDKLGVEYAKDDLDLVALGIVADVISTKPFETRFLIEQGLGGGVKNTLMRHIAKINKQYVDENNITMKDIGWTIAPRINAVTRVGTLEERLDLFYSLVDEYTEDEINEFAKTLEDIRERQNKIRDRDRPIIFNLVEEQELDRHSIIFVEVGDEIESSLKGMIASDVATNYDKPVMIVNREMIEGKEVLRGSGRSVNDIPLRTIADDSGFFILAEGHEGAHGVAIEADKVQGFLEYSDKLFEEASKDSSLKENEVLVDFLLTSDNLHYNLVMGIDKYHDLWGKDVEEPLFGIKDVEVNRSNIITIGQNRDVVKFVHKGIEYIKFRVPDNEIAELKTTAKSPVMVMDIVGTPSINEFRGKKTAQIVIQDFSIKERKAVELPF